MTPEATPDSLLDEALRASALDDALRALNELGPEGGLDRFAASLDPEWIEQALAATGTASIRRRKIPADQVVWVVLGMCLFADRSIVDLVDHLTLVAPGVKSLAPSNVSKARYRVGPQPLRWVFETVADAWGDTFAGHPMCWLRFRATPPPAPPTPDSEAPAGGPAR